MDSNSSIWKKIGLGAAVAGGVIAGAALLPITLGFGTAGIVGGSIAAGIQAAIGNVAAGSLFAVCTSLGMTGVFASTAAVGAILGIGGLAAYLKDPFDPKKDADLISATIRERDDPKIIICLIETRLPSERDKIKEKYYALYERNLEQDIKDYLEDNLKLHAENLLKSTSEIYAKTEPVKRLLNYQSLKDYLERPFDRDIDAMIIRRVIVYNDDPLIIERLFNQRSKEQRLGILEVEVLDSSDRIRRNKEIIAYMPAQERAFMNTLIS